MKKLLLLLLAFAMLLSLAACQQDSGQSKPPKDAELAIGELPELGQVLNGFKVTGIQPGTQRDTTFVYMEHEKSGAKLIYAANDDINRNFNIGFRTPAINDKGMPHIFEHSATGGSEKYPDPLLFYTIMSATYTSYINAATFPTVTCYPLASLSEEQLLANMDVVLNGVFHPLVLSDERVMMREAYHYELDSADAKLALVGTVYSEMQGDLSLQKMNSYAASKALYPGSYYANISGGDPDYIPELSYEELCHFHSAYYKPSNCAIVLYGKLDLQRFLKYLDEAFFSAYERTEVELADKDYVPLNGFKEEINYYPVEEGSTEQPFSSYAFRLKGATREELELFYLVTFDMLQDGGAIERLRMERIPAAQISLSFRVDIPDPCVSFVCMGSMEDQEKFKQLIDDAIAEVLAKGCDDERIIAYSKVDQYSSFLGTQVKNYGVDMSTSLLREWALKGDVDAYRRLSVALEANEANAKQGLPIQVFRKYMEQPAGSVFVITVSEQGGLERVREARAQSLRAKQAAMSQEEIDKLIERTADFKAWTETNAQQSMIDQVKLVTAQELPEELVTAKAQDQNINGMRFISSVFDSDIVFVRMNFDSSTVPSKLIMPLNLYIDLLYDMPTEKHSLEELVAKQNESSYSFSVSMSNYADANSDAFHPVISAQWLTTEEDLDASVELFLERLQGNILPPAEELQARAATIYEIIRSSHMSNVMELANSLARAKLSPSLAYQWKLSGTEYLDFLRGVAQMNTAEIEALRQSMKEALSYALTNKDFTVLAAGAEESIGKVAKAAEAVYKQLPENTHEASDLTEFIAMPKGDMAVVIGGTTYCNYQSINLKQYGMEESGKLRAVRSLVSDKLLFQVLRMERGAYDGQLKLKDSVLSYTSFQDPNLKSTYEYYALAAQLLSELKLTQEELDGYIVSSIAYIANMYTPYSAVLEALEDKLRGGDSFEKYQREMRELKALTPSDVKQIASEILAVLSEQGERLTVGGAAQIEANKELFETIDYSLIR